MRTVRSLICVIAVGAATACSTVESAVDQVFPPTAEAPAADCTRTMPPGRQIGAALVDGEDGPLLLFAGGKGDEISIGGTELSIDAAKPKNLELEVGETDVRLQELSNPAGRTRVMFGSPTRRRVLKGGGPVMLEGTAKLELAGVADRQPLVTAARLAIDPASASATLALSQMAAGDADPIAALEWQAIAYCEGQLLSQGAGRFRMTAPSGRPTRPFGPSADGPDGSGVLSGFVYGPDVPGIAALAFAISGANGSLSGIATFPWPSQ